MKKSHIDNQILSPGYHLGRYTIVRKLSNGGFGVVYLAQRDDQKIVAIKEFLPSILSCRTPETHPYIRCQNEYDEVRFKEGLKVFFREADTLAKINNSRIIPIWDVFKENGTAYFVMPVEKGGTLQALLRLKKENFSEQELVGFFVEACKGVAALHQKGLYHLDIKPSNLWIRPDRSLIVLDLGASRWEDDEMKMSQMARTPGFAAPEQHSHFKDIGISSRTDIYGLCASLLSCLNKKPPLAAPLRKAGMSLVQNLYPTYSYGLLKVIEKGMSMQPAFRQKDVLDLQSELEAVQHHLKIITPRPALDSVCWPDVNMIEGCNVLPQQQ